MGRHRLILFLAITFLASGCIGFGDQKMPDKDNDFSVEKVVEGLESPWAIEFVPETDYVLVTENPGYITKIDLSDNSSERIEGVPEVDDSGQGGLLDIELHPDFNDNNQVYLTYSDSNGEGLATHLGSGTLDLENKELNDFENLHIAEPFMSGGSHFGSRIIFDDEGYLYMTVGDRGVKDWDDHPSQDTSNEIGSTLRLEDDGSIPEDNPFVDDAEVKDSIYSYGHRNSQGMTLHPETREIWQSEHGEQDGDEINIIEDGGNYGWPETHYGCEYGTSIPVGDEPNERDDIINPVYYWECNSGGFPPAGMTFYTGDNFEDWEGGLFVGNLAGQYLGHFEVNGTDVEEQEPMLESRNWRIRDVEEDIQSGYLYVIVDSHEGSLVRIS